MNQQQLERKFLAAVGAAGAPDEAWVEYDGRTMAYRLKIGDATVRVYSVEYVRILNDEELAGSIETALAVHFRDKA